MDEWKSALRAAMREAMRARQAHVVAVLRETLAAIDNAEAVDASAAQSAGDGNIDHGIIAGAVAGLGAAEAQRRLLDAEAVASIVEREIQERKDAAATLAALGKHEEATTLQQQIDVLVALR